MTKPSNVRVIREGEMEVGKEGKRKGELPRYRGGSQEGGSEPGGLIMPSTIIHCSSVFIKCKN